MKTIYLLLALGLLCAVIYADPIPDDFDEVGEPLEEVKENEESDLIEGDDDDDESLVFSNYT